MADFSVADQQLLDVLVNSNIRIEPSLNNVQFC